MEDDSHDETSVQDAFIPEDLFPDVVEVIKLSRICVKNETALSFWSTVMTIFFKPPMTRKRSFLNSEPILNHD